MSISAAAIPPIASLNYDVLDKICSYLTRLPDLINMINVIDPNFMPRSLDAPGASAELLVMCLLQHRGADLVARVNTMGTVYYTHFPHSFVPLISYDTFTSFAALSCLRELHLHAIVSDSAPLDSEIPTLDIAPPSTIFHNLWSLEIHRLAPSQLAQLDTLAPQLERLVLHHCHLSTLAQPNLPPRLTHLMVYDFSMRTKNASGGPMVDYMACFLNNLPRLAYMRLCSRSYLSTRLAIPQNSMEYDRHVNDMILALGPTLARLTVLQFDELHAWYQQLLELAPNVQHIIIPSDLSATQRIITKTHAPNTQIIYQRIAETFGAYRGSADRHASPYVTSHNHSARTLHIVPRPHVERYALPFTVAPYPSYEETMHAYDCAWAGVQCAPIPPMYLPLASTQCPDLTVELRVAYSNAIRHLVSDRDTTTSPRPIGGLDYAKLITTVQTFASHSGLASIWAMTTRQLRLLTRHVRSCAYPKNGEECRCGIVRKLFDDGLDAHGNVHCMPGSIDGDADEDDYSNMRLIMFLVPLVELCRRMQDAGRREIQVFVGWLGDVTTEMNENASRSHSADGDTDAVRYDIQVNAWIPFLGEESAKMIPNSL